MSSSQPTMGNCPEIILNEELFLKMITNFPAIYNAQRKGYSNRQMTDKAWEHIASSMKCSGKL